MPSLTVISFRTHASDPVHEDRHEQPLRCVVAPLLPGGFGLAPCAIGAGLSGTRRVPGPSHETGHQTFGEKAAGAATGR